ncbi:hypothetical protein F4604DRAFT_1932695 [Suillus subluteus]|nr:hypothetical protein F4604DRAFT_1932695 [Suillus subluteus]
MSDTLRALRQGRESLNDDDDDDNNNAVAAAPQVLPNSLHINEPQDQSVEGDVADIIDGPTIEAHVELAASPGGAHDVSALALELGLPNFPTILQQFLYDQLHIADPDPPIFDPATVPAFMGRVSVFSSAAASFYAPSDLSSTGGM